MSEDNFKTLFEQALWERLARKQVFPTGLQHRLQSIQLTGSSEMHRCDIDGVQKEHRILVDGFRVTLMAAPSSFREHLSVSSSQWLKGDMQAKGEIEKNIIQELCLQVSNLSDRQKATIRLNTERIFESKTNGLKLPLHWEGLRLRLETDSKNRSAPNNHLNFFCNYGNQLVEIMTLGGASFDKIQEVLGVIRETIRVCEEYVLANCFAKRSQEVQNKLQELRDQLAVVWSKAIESIKNALHVQRMLTETERQTVTNTINMLKDKSEDLRGSLTTLNEIGIVIAPDFKQHLERFLVETVQLVHEQEKTTTELGNTQQIHSFIQRAEKSLREAKNFNREFGRLQRLSNRRLKQVSNRLGVPQPAEPPMAKSILEQEDHLLRRSVRNLTDSLEDMDAELAIQDLKNNPALMHLKARWLGQREQAQKLIPPLRSLILAEPLDRVAVKIHSTPLLRCAEATLGDLSANMVSEMENRNDLSPGENNLWSSLSALSDAESDLSQKMEGELHQRLNRLWHSAERLYKSVLPIPNHPPMPENASQVLAQERLCRTGRQRLLRDERKSQLTNLVTALLKGNPPVNLHPEIRHSVDSALAALQLSRDHERGRGENYLVELVVVPVASLLEPQDPNYRRENSEIEERLVDEPIFGILPKSFLFGARNIASFSDIGAPGEMAAVEERAAHIANPSGLIGDLIGLHPLWGDILKSDETRVLVREMGDVFTRYGRGFVLRITGSQNIGYQKLKRYQWYQPKSNTFSSPTTPLATPTEENLAEGEAMLFLLTDAERFLRFKENVFNLASLLFKDAIANELSSHQDEFIYAQRDFVARIHVTQWQDLFVDPEHIHDGQRSEKILDLFMAIKDENEREILIANIYHRRLFSNSILAELLKSLYPDPWALGRGMPSLTQEFTARFKWLYKTGFSQSVLTEATDLLSKLAMEDDMLPIYSGVTLWSHLSNTIEEYNHLSGLKRFFVKEKMKKEIIIKLQELFNLGLIREARILAYSTAPPIDFISFSKG